MIGMADAQRPPVAGAALQRNIMVFCVVAFLSGY
jgi:hypothetical protein